MNDEQRAALVEELAEAIHVDAARRRVFTAETAAESCLPIIDRLLAAATAPGMDELLDSVDCPALDIDPIKGNEGGDQAYVAYIMPKTGGVWDGTGPTRMDAIRSAVAQAANA